MPARKEMGDLTPLRRVAERVGEWHDRDAAARPDGDPVVHALAQVSAWISDALDEATAATAELTPGEIAAAEGVTVDAIYKRRKRGNLPNAEKRNGRIRIMKAA